VPVPEPPLITARVSLVLRTVKTPEVKVPLTVVVPSVD
jgi:hypothetical protein